MSVDNLQTLVSIVPVVVVGVLLAFALYPHQKLRFPQNSAERYDKDKE